MGLSRRRRYAQHNEKVWFACPRWGKGQSWHFSSFHLKLLFILLPLAKEKEQNNEPWEHGRRNESWPRHTWAWQSPFWNRIFHHHVQRWRKHQFLAKTFVLSQSRAKPVVTCQNLPSKVSAFPARGDPNNHPALPPALACEPWCHSSGQSL